MNTNRITLFIKELAKFGDLDLIKCFLEKYPDYNKNSTLWYDLLLSSAEYGNIEVGKIAFDNYTSSTYQTNPTNICYNEIATTTALYGQFNFFKQLENWYYKYAELNADIFTINEKIKPICDYSKLVDFISYSGFANIEFLDYANNKMKEFNQPISNIYMKLIQESGKRDNVFNIMEDAVKRCDYTYYWFYFYKIKLKIVLNDKKYQSANWLLLQLLLISKENNISFNINDLFKYCIYDHEKQWLKDVCSQV
jgi:hypothetical protein